MFASSRQIQCALKHSCVYSVVVILALSLSCPGTCCCVHCRSTAQHSETVLHLQRILGQISTVWLDGRYTH
mgnify:CR=1 FL=1